MSEETIKLRVPADVPEGFPEYVSQGNLATDLPRGEVIEVSDRAFADWLVRELGLESLRPVESPLEADYPADFPRREIFIALGIAAIDARGLDRDGLIALNGVGEKTADAVLEYFASETDGDNNGGN